MASQSQDRSVVGLDGMFEQVSTEQAWQLLPKTKSISTTDLPHWVLRLVKELPRSTAALIELDYAQRVSSTINPALRSAMRWIIAKANQCSYAAQIAMFDLEESEVERTKIEALKTGSFSDWNQAEQDALEFARQISVDSDDVSDELFQKLVRSFGERQAASMVLLAAYGNFQDRLLICLGVTKESNPRAFRPIDIQFDEEAFVSRNSHPAIQEQQSAVGLVANSVVTDGLERVSATYDQLQSRLQQQREKPTRLRIPEWSEFVDKLPEGPLKRPSDIVWYRIVFGYAPELAVPFEKYMRTAGEECTPKYERVFATSLFWVTTRAMNCAYCMGHCEMNWEVAGLSLEQIAERSRRLASDDWSVFPIEQQHAFAFARKLTLKPSAISEVDIRQLVEEFGKERALCIVLNASRYHYMTRISNGFQLKLESENVFFDYWGVKKKDEATL